MMYGLHLAQPERADCTDGSCNFLAPSDFKDRSGHERAVKLSVTGVSKYRLYDQGDNEHGPWKTFETHLLRSAMLCLADR